MTQRHKPLTEKTIFFLCDFETTGVDPEKAVPVELAGYFLKPSLTRIKTFHTLINPFPKRKNKWNKEEEEAYSYHRIPLETVKRFGLSPEKTIRKLEDAIAEVDSLFPAEKIIIVSDNAVFEYSFMRKLYQLAKAEERFPFHYTAWDTNILLKWAVPEIGDPPPAHRALEDVERLYNRLVKAYRKIKTFNKNFIWR